MIKLQDTSIVLLTFNRQLGHWWPEMEGSFRSQSRMGLRVGGEE